MLRIDHSFGKIGIDAYNSELQIRSKADKLNLNLTYPKIEIEQEFPQVLIDQSECFSTAGLKSSSELSTQFADEGRQQALAYTAQAAAFGDSLTNIRSRGNPIAENARASFFSQNVFDIDLIPKARPRIDFIGYINFSNKSGEVTGEIEDGYLDINASAPQLRVYYLQEPYLKMQFTGNNIDTYV